MNPGEREITTPVTLVRPDGRLNRDAVGWSRTPLHDTSGLKRGWRGTGRNKRWEYWLVMTPGLLVSQTISDIDYAGVHTVWAYEISTGRLLDESAIAPLAVGTRMPGSLGDGPAWGGTSDLSGRLKAPGSGVIRARVDESPDGARLQATAASRGEIMSVAWDVQAGRTGAGESLAVVVPWSENRFQYTVKDPLRPATGWIEIDGVRHHLPVGESWAVLDHGRGRWPYSMWWNWAAGAGRLADGRAVGIQLGGKWTDGTGARENAVIVDGTLHPIHEDLEWTYDEGDWMSPWRARSASVDLELRPFWNHASATDLRLLSTAANQVFGHWHGTISTPEGELGIDGVMGFAEDVRNRW